MSSRFISAAVYDKNLATLKLNLPLVLNESNEKVTGITASCCHNSDMNRYELVVDIEVESL